MSQKNVDENFGAEYFETFSISGIPSDLKICKIFTRIEKSTKNVI